MLVRPQIDPVAISIGSFDIHWYGIMYLIGFIAAFLIARKNAHRLGISKSQAEDIIFYTGLGVIVGGRIGYALFYQTQMLLTDPFYLFKIWEGGMSFHGGFVGVFLALLFLSYRWNQSLLAVGDFAAPMAPIGLGCGRIGNFINNELWGKISDVPWAMSPAPGLPTRHPSQLYEAFLEGLVLFLIVNWVYNKHPRSGVTAACFLFFYGLFRFGVEFVRLPDPQLGYLAFGWLTMGQVLSLPLIIAGLGIFIAVYACPKQVRC